MEGFGALGSHLIGFEVETLGHFWTSESGLHMRLIELNQKFHLGVIRGYGFKMFIGTMGLIFTEKALSQVKMVELTRRSPGRQKGVFSKLDGQPSCLGCSPDRVDRADGFNFGVSRDRNDSETPGEVLVAPNLNL